MRAILLLADAAQVADGKLYLLGAGWSVTGPGPTPSAVAIKIEVPWDQTNVAHHFELELVDEDGQPVTMPAADGAAQPVQTAGSFEVGRPAGLRPGTPIDVPLAINIGPLALPPDQRFSWRLTIDGQSHEDWQANFSTRPMPA